MKPYLESEQHAYRRTKSKTKNLIQAKGRISQLNMNVFVSVFQQSSLLFSSRFSSLFIVGALFFFAFHLPTKISNKYQFEFHDYRKMPCLGQQPLHH